MISFSLVRPAWVLLTFLFLSLVFAPGMLCAQNAEAALVAPASTQESAESIIERRDAILSAPNIRLLFEISIFDQFSQRNSRLLVDNGEGRIRLLNRNTLYSTLFDNDTQLEWNNDGLLLRGPGMREPQLMAAFFYRHRAFGSDLTYTDLRFFLPLAGRYEFSRLESEDGLIVVAGQLKGNSVPVNNSDYFRRKLWIDPQKYVVLRDEAYDRNGDLLRLIQFDGFQQYGDSWFAQRWTITSPLRENNRTELYLQQVRFLEPAEPTEASESVGQADSADASATQ